MIENVIRPEFVKKFACTADACPDHCCHSWQVHVDKKAFKQLKKTKQIPVKFIADKFLKQSRTSELNWGEISMNSEGNCPFLDKSSLCEIHKTMGHKALPFVCQEYPRNTMHVAEQAELSLSMSCPAAAEEILFNPSAFMFEQHQETSNLKTQLLLGIDDPAFANGFKAIRAACFDIMLFDELNIKQKLFAIGMLIKQGEGFVTTHTRLEEFINNFNGMILDGTVNDLCSKLEENSDLKWRVFSTQDEKLMHETRVTRKGEEITLNSSAQRFIDCRTPFIEKINQYSEKEGVSLEQAFTVIEKKAAPAVSLYFKENPQVLVNYFLYYLYHNYYQYCFVVEKPSLFEFFKVMCVDFFILQNYLYGMALDGGLNDEKVLTLFQSYARRRQHESGFISHMNARLEEFGVSSAGAIFGLLL